MTPRELRRFFGELNGIEAGLEDYRDEMKRREDDER